MHGVCNHYTSRPVNIGVHPLSQPRVCATVGDVRETWKILHHYKVVWHHNEMRYASGFPTCVDSGKKILCWSLCCGTHIQKNSLLFNSTECLVGCWATISPNSFWKLLMSLGEKRMKQNSGEENSKLSALRRAFVTSAFTLSMAKGNSRTANLNCSKDTLTFVTKVLSEYFGKVNPTHSGISGLKQRSSRNWSSTLTTVFDTLFSVRTRMYL